MLFCKKSPHKPGCMIVHTILAVLLLLATLTSLIGVYKAHVLADGLTFGTTTGSLSLIAFAITVVVFKKVMKSCCSKCEVCSMK